ncbi:hypothetical protein QEN19_001550 [Hanseniaspora menglaensis]
MSLKLNFFYVATIYYVVWMGLPIFLEENDFKYSILNFLFPISSQIAIQLPILIMLIGLMIIGTFIGVLFINQQNVVDNRQKAALKVD